MTRILLIRHGEPEESAIGTHYGQLDVDLSETGRSESLRAIERLHSTEIHTVYSSDLLRANWLAERLAADHGAPCHKEPTLRERHLGVFQGMSYAQGFEFDANEANTMREQGAMYRPKGGENLEDLADRVLPTLQRIGHEHSGETIAIPCHGGPIRVIVGHVLGVPIDRMDRISIGYCSTTEIELGGRIPKVRGINR